MIVRVHVVTPDLDNYACVATVELSMRRRGKRQEEVVRFRCETAFKQRLEKVAQQKGLDVSNFLRMVLTDWMRKKRGR